MSFLKNLFSKSSFASITEAIRDYWQKNETVLKSSGIQGPENVSASGLPDEYRDTPYSVPIPGTSKWTDTLGEYQDWLKSHEYDNYQ